MYRLTIKILIVLFILSTFSTEIRATFYDFEDINKTMVVLEEVFASNNESFLGKMSTTAFKKTTRFHKLKQYINNYSINLSEVSESCIKAFPIIYGEFQGYALMVDFSRKYINNTERYWFIEDAYLSQLKSPTKNYNFQMHGFSANAIEYFFRDVIKEIKSKNIINFSGLAKYGKLNPSFFYTNTIVASEKTTFTVSDVIIYAAQTIKDICFLRLEYIKDNKRKSRGWLINDFGSMYDVEIMKQKGFAKYSIQNANWNNYLINKSHNFDFNKQSPYMYTNIAHLNENNINQNNNSSDDISFSPTNRKIQLKKILVQNIKWNLRVLNLNIDLKDFNYINDENLSTNVSFNIVEEKLRIVFTKQQINCISITHNFLDIYCNEHLLDIQPKFNSPYYFSQSTRVKLTQVTKNNFNNTMRLSFKIESIYQKN